MIQRWTRTWPFAAALVLAACGGRNIRDDIEPTASTADAKPAPKPPLTSSAKLDLLIVVDNSTSMLDKQEALKLTVPELVRRLTDPSSGVRSLHVGVITSSLGGHGSTLCQGKDGTGNVSDEEVDDHGHLVATRPRFAAASAEYPGAQAPTADGFLDWNPSMDTSALERGIESLVTAAGDVGCGLESQLEAMYRFLADPNPSLEITTFQCPGLRDLCAAPAGRDDALLAERAAFLRPDSVVAVVQFSDENDCSIRENGQYYYAARNDLVLPRASSACDTNPNDRCCYPCGAPEPDGCPSDPSCANPPDKSLDNINLRCFDEKRRFGVDFLYPIGRYLNALTRTEICTSRADLDPSPGRCPDDNGDGHPDIALNPLFRDLTGHGARVRTPSMVHLLSIVGVPWQDLESSVDAAGKPLPDGVFRYAAPAELTRNDTWSVILGAPDPGGGAPPVPPTDTLMVESVEPRTGVDGQGQSLAGPSAGALTEPVNGHERLIPKNDDLEYACIFPLATPRDCARSANVPNPKPDCNCEPGTLGNDNPVCQDPSTGAYGTDQLSGSAYPGLRQLALVKAVDKNGALASICARHLDDVTAADRGYEAAVGALMEQIAPSLAGAVDGGPSGRGGASGRDAAVRDSSVDGAGGGAGGTGPTGTGGAHRDAAARGTGGAAGTGGTDAATGGTRGTGGTTSTDAAPPDASTDAAARDASTAD